MRSNASSTKRSAKRSAWFHSERRDNFVLIASGIVLGYLGRLVLGGPIDETPARTFHNPEITAPAEDVIDLPIR